jgi:hypothetical protein
MKVKKLKKQNKKSGKKKIEKKEEGINTKDLIPQSEFFLKLSPAHQRFVKAYISTYGKQTRAYMEAYSQKNRKAASVGATMIMKRQPIRDAIEAEYKRIWGEKDLEIEKSKTYLMIHAIGESNIADVVDLENGSLRVKDLSKIPLDAQQAIQAIEFEEKETQYGVNKSIKVKMHPKLAALELRAKIQKMISDKMEFEGEIIVRPARRPDEYPDEKPGEIE